MQHKAVHLLFCKFTQHVSGVNHTHHQEYTKLQLQPPLLVIFFVQLRPSNLTKLSQRQTQTQTQTQYILTTIQRTATQSILFIILRVHSTCFGCQPHPSSVVHKTVTTASGTGHIFCAASSLQRGQASLATLVGGSCGTGGCS